MHFWIDKPTGRCPRIHGRRYRMNVPKSHFASHHHHRYAIDDVAGLHMFPPLPRFQSNDVSSAGPSNNPRPLRPSVHESVDRTDTAQPGFHQLGQDNISNINSNNTGNNQRVLPQSTNDTNRGLLNVLECKEADMRVYNVGITLVTVIAFLAVTRFYFDYQQSEGIQVFVIFGLLAFLLLYRCIIRILCPTVPPNHHHHHHHLQGTTPVSDPIATVTVLNTISNESISDVSMPIRQNPPPPYHIAILIPPPTSTEEAPPPAYDKIIH